MTRHTPNHEPDDLRQPRRTDATPHAEADALDRLLNEIAQEPGSASTRSASRPNDRTPPTADEPLAASARDFHRRYAAAEARDRGAGGLDPTLWEQIMASSAPPNARVTSGNPWLAGTSAASDSRPMANARHWLPTRTWTGLANATLALLIIAAAFATWQVYDRVNNPGGSDTPPTSTVPGLAMQPSTPEEVNPAATPTPAFACDFSADIPIFPNVETVPIEGTALRITPRGDLILTCPEEPGGMVLAEGVTGVLPMFWPGMVQLFGEGRPGAQPVSVLDVFTGRSIILGVPPQTTTNQSTQPMGSPWLVTSTADKPGDWLIIDLHTMESRLYTEITGTAPLPDGTILDAASNGSRLVLTPWYSEYPGNAGRSHTHVLLDEPEAVVVDGMLTASRLIRLPADLPGVYQTLLSPDGEHLALKATEGGDGETIGKTTYSVIQTTNGSEVGRSATFDDPVSAMLRPMTTMRWVQDGAGLAYTQGTALMLLPTAGGDPVPVLELDDHIGDLQNTGDPNVVVAHVFEESDLASANPTVASQRLISVDTVSGEARGIDGFDVSHRMSWDSATHFLVISDTRIMNMDGVTASFRVVDAVTGEVVGEIIGIEITQDPNGGAMDLRSVASTRDGAVEVVAFSATQIYLLRDANGTPEVIQLPAPNATVASHVHDTGLWLSDDGSLLSLTIDSDETGTRYLLDLNDPDVQWLAAPSPDGPAVTGYGPSPIYFIPGTGD